METTDSTDKIVRKIVVLGGGSAGFLAAVAIAKKLTDVELTVIRSTKMGVIGVGEGTIPSVVQFLHRFLGIDVKAFNRGAQPSIKLGIKYIWGKRPFFNYTFSAQLTQNHPLLPIPKGYFCQDDFEYADLNSALMRYGKVALRRRDGAPHFNPNFAYHMENEKFVSYFETLGDELGIHKIDAIVDEVKVGPDGVESLKLDDGRIVEGDLFIDASGFRAELIDKALKEPYVDFGNALFCDRAVVGGWERSDEDPYNPYTTAETMDAGWAWQIEHDDLVNRGYVFCSRYLSEDEAVAEFTRKNPKVKMPRVISFNAGVRKRTWVKNVVSIGNSAGFVEPIEATAIGMICDSVSRLIRGLSASNMRLLDIQRDIYNRIVFKNWEIIRDFIALHYKFNNRLDTPFWKMCQNEVPLGEAQEIADYFKEVGPDFSFINVELKRDFFTAEGYIAMLVGQQVEYKRTLNIDANMRSTWKQFKQRLASVVDNALTMDEYLDSLRNTKLKSPYSQNGTPGQPNQKQTVKMGDEKEGELNWH